MPVSWCNYASGPWCLELLLRACKWAFGEQGGAAHIEQHPVRKVWAQARYWRPPRQRMDQVPPRNQPRFPPNSRAFPGLVWGAGGSQDFPEATHRPGDSTCLTATPHRHLPPSLHAERCQHQSGNSHLLPRDAATGARGRAAGITRGGGRQGEGGDGEKGKAGKRGTRA